MRPFICALLTSLAAVPAAAQQSRSIHTLPPDVGVYRIEVRGLDRFAVQTVGDTDGVGDLHAIELALHAQVGPQIELGEQVHILTAGSPQLSTVSQQGGTTSLDIRPGDIVQIHPHQTGPLWIHDRRVPETDRPLSMDFELSIRARELDCGLDLLCDRGNEGWVRLLMHIVLPRAIIGATCGRSNTFAITSRDGQPTILGRDILRLTSVLRYSDPRNLRAERSGPHLIPLSGEICITTSTDSDAWSRVSADRDPNQDRWDEVLGGAQGSE